MKERNSETLRYAVDVVGNTLFIGVLLWAARPSPSYVAEQIGLFVAAFVVVACIVAATLMLNGAWVGLKRSKVYWCVGVACDAALVIAFVLAGYAMVGAALALITIVDYGYDVRAARGATN